LRYLRGPGIVTSSHQLPALAPKAAAIADTRHVRENVTERGVYAASPSGNPRLRQIFNERMLKRHECRGPGGRSPGRIFLSSIFLSFEPKRGIDRNMAGRKMTERRRCFECRT
jgi:hypothetical protein